MLGYEVGRKYLLYVAGVVSSMQLQCLPLTVLRLVAQSDIMQLCCKQLPISKYLITPPSQEFNQTPEVQTVESLLHTAV